MNEVWDALKDDELSMISICGMGGVGKTTMVEKLVKRVEKEKLFDEVAMAVVSQNPDFKKIQGEIAAPLGFKFDEEILNVRVGKLRHRIMNLMNGGKKVLIILDDVWDKLDFGKIGLPSGNGGKGFKIMLTSRNEDVCKIMGSQRNFRINVLSDDEAWALFREMAGGDVEHSDINPIARQVAKECRGLPIAIAIVARTLVEDGKDIWEAVLQDLRAGIPENILGMQDEVFSRIELSYNWLRSEEAQSCFLLCCLFPEDFSIPVEYLVRYGIGLRLFEGVGNLHQARNKVSMLIKKLKRSFLLLEGTVERNGYETVKMHDLVRDVAINITSKEKHSYLVNCDAKMKEWPKIVRYEHCNAISLLCENIKEHPSDLQCPKLELLQLLGHCQNLPNNFFQGIKELKVLSLNIPSLPESFGILENLQALYLKISMWGDTSILGALINLKILKIETFRLEMLPEAIGLLTNLRLLDLSDISNLGYIPSGVLSKLSKLEEFYVTQSFRKWESMENGEKTNASLKEIETHPVTALEIWVPTVLFLPKFSFLKNLERFKISIGGSSEKEFGQDSTNKLFLDSDASSETNVLLRKTEVLELSRVQRLKNDLCELQYDGFCHLKTTSNSSFEELSWFSNLKDIKISKCNKLKNVFPLSMARGLTQLQSIQINSCKEIEGIFCGKKVDDKIEFPKLIELKLISLPKLIGFCIDMDDPAMKPSLTSSQDALYVSNNIDDQTHQIYFQAFPSKLIARMSNLKYFSIEGSNTLEVIFSFEECHDPIQALNSLEYLHLRALPNLQHICFNIPPKIRAFQNLRNLNVGYCGNLIYLFSPSVAKLLVNLQTVTILSCKKMEEIIAKEDEEANMADKIEFPQLRFLDFHKLPKLRSFYSGNYALEFPSLETMDFYGCLKMRAFSYGPLSTPKLVKATINDEEFGIEDLNATVKEKMFRKVCIHYEETLTRIGYDQLPEDLSKLLILQIEGCQNWVNIIPCNLIASLQNLEKLVVENCESVKEIFEYEGVNIEEEENVVTFSHLEELELLDLQELDHIFNKIPKSVIAFQKLRKLTVYGYNRLRNIFSVHVAKGLVQLQELNVSNSRMLEEIVAKEDEEEQEASLDRIVFTQLKSLEFWRLSNLWCFYSGIYALELPLLETLSFKECDRMKTFSCGSLTTPKLKELKINRKNHQVMEDLNATMTHLFNSKEEVISTYSSSFYHIEVKEKS